MIRSLLAGLGRFALLLASAALLSTMGLLVFGTWLLSLPLTRCSPQEKRLKASVNLASAILSEVMAFQSTPPKPRSTLSDNDTP